MIKTLLGSLFAVALMTGVSLGQYTIGGGGGSAIRGGGGDVTPYTIGGAAIATPRSTTIIANPYGVRNGEPYKYSYRRNGTRTSIVVYPDFDDRVLIQNIKEPDHWQRARLDYFQTMYGPNGIYTPKH